MKNLKSLLNRKTLFMNTLIVIITSFIIKVLGLLNRIIITRLLGLEGMSLYVLSFPTLLLFISISGMSLNITVSKLVAESIQTRKYSPNKILNKSLKISFIVSCFTALLFLLTYKMIVNHFLKNTDLIIPIFACLPLIFLVGISDSLRGYFNGLKEMKISCISMLSEQIVRITSSIILIIIFLPKGIITATFFCLLAQSIGELGSIIYTLIKLKKIKTINYPNTKNETKAILSMAIPTTLAKLIGNFTYFLEPIVYTGVLLFLKYDSIAIQTEYTIINAYTIPLLTTSSFFSMAIASSIVPHVSESFAKNDINQIHHYTEKAMIYSLIPGLIMAIILYNYPAEIMNLIYGTTSGSSLVKPIVFIFLIHYLHAPVLSILQAMGKTKLIFVTSTVFNITRIILIAGLSFIPSINYMSVLYAIIISMVFSALVNIYQVVKITDYRFNQRNIINLFLLGILTFLASIILKHFQVHYLLSCFLLLLFFLMFLKALHLVQFRNSSNH